MNDSKKSAATPRALEMLGRRRTAYPLDLSFNELFELDLFVPPRLSRGGHHTVGTSSVTHWLAGSESVLVLGEPGSGKSLFTYATLRALAQEDVGFVILDLASLCAAVVESQRSEVDPLDFLLYADPNLTPVESDRTSLCIAIDAIDEVLAAGVSGRVVGEVLEWLLSGFNCLVVSRRHEFETLVSGSISTSRFSKIIRILPWRFEYEFSDFVRRLADNAMVVAPDVMKAVEGSAQLRALVERPLHARMLTYVLRQDLEIDGLTSLYCAYLARLGDQIDAQSRLQADGVHKALTLWKASSYELYQSQKFRGGRISYSTLLDCLERHGAPSGESVRIAQGIYNVSDEGPATAAEPVHFSFLEFCIAWYICDGIVGQAAAGNHECDIFGEREVSREVRRYIAELIGHHDRDLIIAWLVAVYRRFGGRIRYQPVELVRLNSVIYYLGRIGGRAVDQLVEVVREEKNGFLLNSAYWSLAATGEWAYCTEYLLLLSRTPQLRSINRGYHLFYFGDSDSSQLPPYVDSGHASWTNTRGRLTEYIMSAVSDEGGATPRTALDCATLIDFLQDNSIDPTRRELDMLRKAVTAVKAVNPDCADALASIIEGKSND